MAEIIPTSASLRITGSRQEIDLVLEAMAIAGWHCTSNQKLYSYNDKGKTKYSLYVNDLQVLVQDRAQTISRGELRSRISDLEADLAAKREQLLASLRQLGGEVEAGRPRPWDVVLGGKNENP